MGEVLKKEDHPHKGVLMAGNHFFSDDAPEMISRRHLTNHIISLRYQDALKGGKDQKMVFIEMCEFLMDHIYFNKSDSTELKSLMRDMYKEIILELEKKA